MERTPAAAFEREWRERGGGFRRLVIVFVFVFDSQPVET